jgi:hypothetical protein
LNCLLSVVPENDYRTSEAWNLGPVILNRDARGKLGFGMTEKQNASHTVRQKGALAS